MEVNNPLYKNQGIHVISTIFTVDHGVVKILLIKRRNEPFKDKWALVGGALYNNEDLLDGLKREIKEKTGIDNIDVSLVDVHGKVHRSPVMRMVAISYLGVIDINSVNYLKETAKSAAAEWIPINLIKDLELAYDHQEIIASAFEALKVKILNSNILVNLFPNGFTLPELQKVYEAILEKKLDRRNFRRRILSLNLIEDTLEYRKFEGNKPAKLYKFKDKIENINLF